MGGRMMVAALLLGCAGAQTGIAQSGGVPRYDVFEAALTAARSYSNPFSGVTVTVAFKAPSGKTVTATAFHDGGSTWRVRVAPDEVGTWTWTTTSTDPSDSGLHGRSGSFTCASSSNKGFIRADASKKYWFSFSDGSPFYGVGDTCYGMVTSLSNSQRTNYLDVRSGQKINFVRFFAGGYPFIKHSSLSAGDAWAWGGSSGSPDYDRFNPQYFRRLESILGEFKARGLFAEVEVFTYYAAPFQDPSIWTASRQNAWAKYLLSRLSAYSTVFLWTVTNEYELYPDGKYRYDGASDDNWVKSMGALFHASDPQRHPTTAHNFTFDANGGIGGRFGSSVDVDVLSHQCWGAATFNGQFMDGDASGIEQAIWTDRTFNKPVINTENGYEWLSGYPHADNGAANGTDKCRKAAWRVFASGGATYAAGFQGTWRGTSETEWLGLDAPWIVADQGLAPQLGHYANFIQTKTAFRNLTPSQSLVNSPNLCLANAWDEYVVYAPSGGTVTLNLSAVGGSYAVEWLNPRSGSYQGQTTVSGGASRNLSAPDGNDWVLHLKLSSGGGPVGLPDVVLTALSYSNGIFQCTVKNQGTAATPPGVMVGVGYFVDDVWRSYGATVGPLAAGAAETVGTNGDAFVIPNGNHTIRAYVDDVNRFAESNEGNNQLTQTVTLGSSTPCDVVVTALSYSNGIFTCTVRNQGGAATPSGVSIGVGYSVDGTWRTYGSVAGPLGAGNSVVIGTTGGAYTIPSGTHTITAWADDVNRFAESNENNNQLSQTVTVGVSAPSSLMARWTLDEGGGASAGDSSGNGNHGALVNGPAWSAGNRGGALNFDGVDDRVQVPDSASLDLAGQGTIAAWIFPRSLPDGYAAVVEKMAGGGQGAGYQLLLGASNTASLWLMSGGTSSSLDSDANLFALNTWTHIAVTWDGTSVRFYRNGQAFGAARAQPRNAAANTLPLVLGLDTGYTGRLNGLLDDVQLYNRALNLSEIQALNAGGATTASAQPLVTLSGQGDYTTIGDALGGAQAGDVVILGATTFLVPDGLTIPPGVSLRGAGPDLTVLDGEGAPVVLRVLGVAADGAVNLEELTVTDGTLGIDSGEADVRLLNVRDETAVHAGSSGGGGGSCGATGIELLAFLGFIWVRRRHPVESGLGTR